VHRRAPFTHTKLHSATQDNHNHKRFLHTKELKESSSQRKSTEALPFALFF
jgi:hypothetical protein